LHAYCAECRAITDRKKALAFREEHIEEIKERERIRRKSDEYKAKRKLPRNRLDTNMSTYLRRSLVGGKKGKSWQTLVGFTADQLAEHIERQFLRGMSWQNMGSGHGKWNIDHILPRKMFSYQSADDPDFKICWALNNLRPMWSIENTRKGGKRIHLL